MVQASAIEDEDPTSGSKVNGAPFAVVDEAQAWHMGSIVRHQ